MDFYISAYTDIGIRKKVNQDSVVLLKARTKTGRAVLAVLCDGMGGLLHGEIASATVVNAFSRWFSDRFAVLSQKEIRQDDIRDDWTAVVRRCNEAIKLYGDNGGFKVGTTAVALLIADGRYYLMNIGDSRCYVINDSVTQLSRDHSYVEEQVRLGAMTREQAKRSPVKNVLTRCIGVAQSAKPEFFFGEITAPCVYILCSDGLCHKAEDEELQDYLFGGVLADPTVMGERERELTELVKQRGESDNITVAAVVVT